MADSIKWSLLGSLLIYLGLVVMRNSHLKYSSKVLSVARQCCGDDSDRRVDISDSRLSNFDSDSSDRDMGTSELLTVDRVIPLTKTLNRVMDKIVRKFALQVTLEDKKILSLNNEYLNLTYFENENNNGSERKVFGRNPFLSRLDSLKRMGNAYIAEDTDKTIVIVQKLHFQVFKQSYDFYDDKFTYLGGCSFTFNNNVFLLSIELSTTYDNSGCNVRSVRFTLVPDKKSFTLRIEGLTGTEALYEKLKSLMYDNFVTKVSPAVEHELLPILMKLIDQADICSLFDAKSENLVDNLVNPDDNTSTT